MELFDTHCHLNFKAFSENRREIILRAHKEGVRHMVIPGADADSSKLAVSLSQEYEGMFAAVGIHPHHVFGLRSDPDRKKTKGVLRDIELLCKSEKVAAIGEVGLDRHIYTQTKYAKYGLDHEFMNLQKEVLGEQIRMAVQHGKSLILHNREAHKDLLSLLDELWDERLRKKTVFHCCEPEQELLAYAKKRGIYIGVDGDVTFSPEKQEFVKQIPPELLILETDSPFLLPEPLRSQRKRTGIWISNEPKNVVYVAKTVAELWKYSLEDVAFQTTRNAKFLFGIRN